MALPGSLSLFKKVVTIMTEEEAISEVLKMSEEKLQMMASNPLRWHCCVEGCERYTKVKDFGIAPFYRWRKHWENIQDRIFFCAKHWKIFNSRPALIVYKSKDRISTIEEIQKPAPDGQQT